MPEKNSTKPLIEGEAEITLLNLSESLESNYAVDMLHGSRVLLDFCEWAGFKKGIEHAEGVQAVVDGSIHMCELPVAWPIYNDLLYAVHGWLLRSYLTPDQPPYHKTKLLFAEYGKTRITEAFEKSILSIEKICKTFEMQSPKEAINESVIALVFELEKAHPTDLLAVIEPLVDFIAKWMWEPDFKHAHGSLSNLEEHGRMMLTWLRDPHYDGSGKELSNCAAVLHGVQSWVSLAGLHAGVFRADLTSRIDHLCTSIGIPTWSAAEWDTNNLCAAQPTLVLGASEHSVRQCVFDVCSNFDLTLSQVQEQTQESLRTAVSQISAVIGKCTGKLSATQLKAAGVFSQQVEAAVESIGTK